MVITRNDKAASLLVEAMQTDDVRLIRYAISLISLAKGAHATKAFVDVLDSLPADGKVLMLRALGARGDRSAAQAIAVAARDEEQPVRVAALEALGYVGDQLKEHTAVMSRRAVENVETPLFDASRLKLKGNEQTIYASLGREPLHVDQIIAETNLPPGAVNAGVMSLRLKGLIKQLPGNLFVRP